jgi:hypothetical protein
VSTNEGEQLVAAVRLIATGDALLAPARTRRLIETQVRPQPSVNTALIGTLTEREREVLVLMARGLDNGQIAGSFSSARRPSGRTSATSCPSWMRAPACRRSSSPTSRVSCGLEPFDGSPPLHSAGVSPSIYAVDEDQDGAYMLIIRPPDDVYVDEPYLSIRWDGIHHHVFSEWKAFANSTELRTSLLKGIRAIREHTATAYVSDARKVKVIIHDDQKWIKETWMPLAIRAGLRRIAFVTAATGLGKLTIEDVSVLVDQDGLQSRTFDSIAAARQWVAEVPASG